MSLSNILGQYFLIYYFQMQWNCLKTATYGPVLADLYRVVAALQRWIAMFYCYLGPGRLAVLERWLPNSVTTLDRFHCIGN